MNKKTTRLTALLAVGLLTIGASLARTDMLTTMQTFMPGTDEGDKPMSSTTTYSRRNAQRVETAMSIAGAEQKTITLTLCDKKVTYTLDPGLKIYYATSLSDTDAAQTKDTGKRTTGKMAMTLVSLRDMGERTIGTYKTQCYEITMRNQTSGCLGNSDTTTKQEICTAPNQAQGAGEEFACGTGSTSASGGCVATVERQGDKTLWARYDKVMRDLRVSTRLAVGDGEEGENAATEMRLVKVSRDKLPDSLFVLPAGYRQLSMQQFQAEQSKALMQKMMQRNGADDTNQDDTEDTEEAPDEN